MPSPKLSNWAKTVIVLLVILFLMIFPPTRHFIMFLLPLGSGIDDLIFFIVLSILIAVLAIKFADTDRVKDWLIHFFSK